MVNGALSATHFFNGAFSSSLLHHISTEKLNHRTAVLFNGSLSARTLVMGLCLLAI